MPREWIGIVLTLVLVVGATTTGVTQETPNASAETEVLGVSFDRIKYKLDTLPERDEVSNLLQLDFYVEVYARAPEIDYFQGFDLENSPVADGVPMTDELMEAMTAGDPPLVPPTMNLGNLLAWLQDHSF
jgi:hypothetical protein